MPISMDTIFPNLHYRSTTRLVTFTRNLQEQEFQMHLATSIMVSIRLHFNSHFDDSVHLRLLKDVYIT